MDEPIAIIGLDARFPGDGDTPEAFYELLLAGRSARTEVPPDRYKVNSFWHPDPGKRGTTRVRHGHFLKGSISAFDAPFFSITSKEAASMDPQQRGMLECVFRALENAGIPLEAAAGSPTGVYVGCFSSDYRSIMEKDLDQDLTYAATGNVVSMLSNRVSWFYDLRGPSLTIDTACSSSLVAAHQACNSLKLRETSMAIVGGCNLILSNEFSMTLDKGGVLGPDGICRSFDEKGNGYGRGEGFGVIVLKRVSDCIRDGDTIRAVIRNSGSNQDGRSPGITQPTKAAQMDLIQRVYSQAGLDMSLTRFFEAHGTGTSVGDPIEASAIGEVFGPFRSVEEPLYVGALKSNIGHLEGASGVAAMIKGVYTLEQGVIPANTWLERLNPKIQNSWHLQFPTKALRWPQPGLRRMSINSFGVGGSNAHIVLDDALHFLRSYHLIGYHQTVAVIEVPPILSLPYTNGHTNGYNSSHVNGNGINGIHSPYVNGNGINGIHSPYVNGNGINGTHPPLVNGNGINGAYLFDIKDEGTDGYVAAPSYHLFPWSSHDQDGILRVCDLLNGYLDKKSKQLLSSTKKHSFLRDLCYTLAVKRTHHGWRCFALAESYESLHNALSSKPVATRTVLEPCLAFIFTGQGAQWATMGKELMTYSVFQRSLCEADKFLSRLNCHWSLIFELLKGKDVSRINRAEFSQPLCTALQVALVDLLFSWGIFPNAVAGHSSGEIAAAYAAGSISRESAWRIAYYRGKLCAKLALVESHATTGMAAVALTREQTESSICRVNELLREGTLEIACMNSPESHTVSGDLAKVEALVDMLTSERIFARKLNVEMAYHSRHMKPIYDEYINMIRYIEPGSKAYPHEARFFSSTRGTIASASELRGPSYWADNLVSPVRFNEAVMQMLTTPTQKASGQLRQEVLQSVTDILEVGPHNALHGPLRAILKASKKADTLKLHTMLKRNESAVDTALNAAGSLWARGNNVELQKINNANRNGDNSCMLTDLPSYPFNHSIEYWFESRLSQASRQPRYMRHELLGAPVPDWNKNMAVWRHRISTADSPWLEDHKVFDDILYPAAGMLVMAIEASLQLSDSANNPKGFKFSDVSFHQALKVPNDTGVESHFYLRPCAEVNAMHDSTWSEFQLFTLVGDEWIEHCRGHIQLEYEVEVARMVNGCHKPPQSNSLHKQIHNTKGLKQVPSKKMYSAFRNSGNDFGPCFQTLEEIWVSPTLTQSIVKNPTTLIKASMPYQYLQSHVVHPASLDGVIQANLVPLVYGSAQTQQAFVPFYARELWISATSLDIDDRYMVSARAERRGPLKAESSFTAINNRTGLMMVKGDGFVLRAVPSSKLQQVEKSSRHIAFHLNWKVDPTLASPLAIVKGSVDDTGPTYSLLAYESLSLEYMRSILDSDLVNQIGKMSHHHQLYMAYMKYAVENITMKPIGYDIDKLRESPEGALIIAVGQALPQILMGEIDPLEVFFSGKLADDFYQRAFGAERCFAQLGSYLDALVHKNPAMNFLEIGAGTGGTTKSVMRALTQYDGRYMHYCFTDISPAFFEEARKLFREHSGRMGYKVLNIEKSIEDQGFKPGHYDIVIAANVLHATQNIETTLRNTRKLLKPGGKLLLYECTNPTALNVNLVFGTLPGWWLSQEPHRTFGPLMTRGRWSEHLETAGFSGLDAIFPDFPDPIDQFGSILVSTATGPIQPVSKLAPAFIIKLGESSTQLDVAVQMHNTLTLETPCEIVDLTRIGDQCFQKSTCIVLADLDSPVLRNPSPEIFASLKYIIVHSNKLIWLSRDGSTNPDYELLAGFARVIRAEDPQLQFITVSYDSLDSISDIVDTSLNILRTSDNTMDNSFRVINGSIEIARVVSASQISKHIQAQTSSLEAVEGKLERDLRALSLQIGVLSQLDTLRFEDDPVFETPLAECEVEFKVMAAGASFRDLTSVLGQVDEDVVLGLEAAGVVTRAGAGSTFKVGDKIFGLSTSGTLKTHARSHDKFLKSVPEAMTWTAAACIPFAYSAAYAVLVELGNIQDGDTILIHSAAGGLGQAAIQLAQHRGAEVFVTAGTQEKQDFLHATYGIPRSHIFSSRNLSFKEGLHRLTNSRGVDVVLNSLSGDGLMASWECVAPFGRFVELGVKNSSAHTSLSVRNLGRNIRFEQFDYVYLINNDPTRAQRVFQRAMKEVLNDGFPRRTPIVVYPFSQVQDAFRDIQSRERIGKIVLEPHCDDVVSIIPSRKPTAHFDPNVSFIIVGGFGGLGQAIARWMVSRGAKNLILLSRSGPVKAAAKAFLEELKPLCQRVAAPPCDVADKEALEKCIKECLQYMPLIKGCIQGSMVLKDNRFIDMSLEEWNDALRPKVDASWNLHHVLGHELDFFVLLSSTMGIVGNKEQSNYAAGNTFNDSLARYRRSRGLPAVSLDLPAIEDVGFVAEKPELLESMRAAGNGSMPVGEVLAVLDYHCGVSPQSSPIERAQVILRPGLPHELAALGIAQPAWMRDPLFSQLGQLELDVAADQRAATKKEAKYATRLATTTSMAEAEEIVLQALLLKLSRVLSIDPSDLDPGKPLHAYGVDSLVAVDVRSWLLKDLGSEVSVFDMNSQASINHLAKTATAKNRFLPMYTEG